MNSVHAAVQDTKLHFYHTPNIALYIEKVKIYLACREKSLPFGFYRMRRSGKIHRNQPNMAATMKLSNSAVALAAAYPLFGLDTVLITGLYDMSALCITTPLVE